MLKQILVLTILAGFIPTGSLASPRGEVILAQKAQKPSRAKGKGRKKPAAKKSPEAAALPAVPASQRGMKVVKALYLLENDIRFLPYTTDVSVFSHSQGLGSAFFHRVSRTAETSSSFGSAGTAEATNNVFGGHGSGYLKAAEDKATIGGRVGYTYGASEDASDSASSTLSEHFFLLTPAMVFEPAPHVKFGLDLTIINSTGSGTSSTTLGDDSVESTVETSYSDFRIAFGGEMVLDTVTVTMQYRLKSESKKTVTTTVTDGPDLGDFDVPESSGDESEDIDLVFPSSLLLRVLGKLTDSVFYGAEYMRYFASDMDEGDVLVDSNNFRFKVGTLADDMLYGGQFAYIGSTVDDDAYLTADTMGMYGFGGFAAMPMEAGKVAYLGATYYMGSAKSGESEFATSYTRSDIGLTGSLSLRF